MAAGKKMKTAVACVTEEGAVGDVASAEPTSAPAIADEIQIVIGGNCRVAALRRVMELMSNARHQRAHTSIRSAGSAPPQNG